MPKPLHTPDRADAIAPLAARRLARAARSLALLSLAGLLVACGNDTGIPHPDPLPDVTRMRSSALMPNVPGTVAVIGLPGAVGGKGTVTIETLGKSFSGASTGSGTFTLDVESRAHEQLAIRFQASDPAFKPVAETSMRVPKPPGPIPGVPPITALGGGKVRIQGRSANVTDVGALVFAVDERTGEVATGTTQTGGDFTIELTAATGDTLDVYDDADPIGGSWPLTAP